VAQSPPTTAKVLADFSDAVRNARFPLQNGPIDCAINNLEKAIRCGGEVGNPHAAALANFASALAPAFEAVPRVEMYMLDLFPGKRTK
jgi:hypothetical protein